MRIQKLLNQSNAKNYSGQSPMVRLVLHRINKDDGTGGYSWNDIRNAVQGAATLYEPFNVCFTVIQENTINKTDYFDILDKYSINLAWQDMVDNNREENAINIYFLPNAEDGNFATGHLFSQDITPYNSFPTITIGDKVGGAYDALSDVMLAHEIGHCLGLFHTHEPTFDSNENLVLEQIHRTGSQNSVAANCTTAGDLLCDTPADYNLAFSTDNVNDNTCSYIGNRTLNGLLYSPLTQNIMSYTLPTCMESFTEEQGERIRNFILNSTVLDDYVIREDRTVEGTITAANRYYGVEGTITTTANHIYPNVLYEAGEAVNLEVGFDIDASSGGSMEAKIGDYSCLEPLTRNDARVGNPNQPIANANGVSIIKSRDIIEEAIFDETLAVSPNPFDNSFSLRFDLAETQAVSLVVYDALGRVVETVLRNDKLQKGNHLYKINGSDLENGLYYVTLKHSSGTQTIKVIKQ